MEPKQYLHNIIDTHKNHEDNALLNENISVLYRDVCKRFCYTTKENIRKNQFQNNIGKISNLKTLYLL